MIGLTIFKSDKYILDLANSLTLRKSLRIDHCFISLLISDLFVSFLKPLKLVLQVLDVVLYLIHLFFFKHASHVLIINLVDHDLDLLHSKD
jgi:hypothetical protein